MGALGHWIGTCRSRSARQQLREGQVGKSEGPPWRVRNTHRWLLCGRWAVLPTPGPQVSAQASLLLQRRERGQAQREGAREALGVESGLPSEDLALNTHLGRCGLSTSLSSQPSFVEGLLHARMQLGAGRQPRRRQRPGLQAQSRATYTAPRCVGGRTRPLRAASPVGATAGRKDGCSPPTSGSLSPYSPEAPLASRRVAEKAASVCDSEPSQKQGPGK